VKLGWGNTNWPELLLLKFCHQPIPSLVSHSQTIYALGRLSTASAYNEIDKMVWLHETIPSQAFLGRPHNFLNQACATASRSAWFPEIVLRKMCVCMYVCMHVCMYICLSFCTHVSKPFTWSLKAACIQIIKAKQSLYYTQTQVSSALKVCFFPYWKPGVATVHKPRSQLS